MKGKNFSLKNNRHKQAAIDFSEEAGLLFEPNQHEFMIEKHQIRKLLLNREIDKTIELINKIDKSVKL